MEKIKNIYLSLFFKNVLRIDWFLLLFLISILNTNFKIKLVIVIIAYVIRPNFKFNFTKNRLPFFYPAILLLILIQILLNYNIWSVNYFKITLISSLFWVISILILHQIVLFLEKNTVERIENTIIVFFIINSVFSYVDLIKIIYITGAINPYTFNGMQFIYGPSTGDHIYGLFNNNSLTNMFVSSLGCVYFLLNRKYIIMLITLSVALLTTSNLGICILLSTLVIIFVFKKEKLSRIIIISLIGCIVAFYSRVTPDNTKYLVERLSFKSSEGLYVKNPNRQSHKLEMKSYEKLERNKKVLDFYALQEKLDLEQRQENKNDDIETNHNNISDKQTIIDNNTLEDNVPKNNTPKKDNNDFNRLVTSNKPENIDNHSIEATPKKESAESHHVVKQEGRNNINELTTNSESVNNDISQQKIEKNRVSIKDINYEKENNNIKKYLSSTKIDSIQFHNDSIVNLISDKKNKSFKSTNALQNNQNQFEYAQNIYLLRRDNIATPVEFLNFIEKKQTYLKQKIQELYGDSIITFNDSVYYKIPGKISSYLETVKFSTANLKNFSIGAGGGLFSSKLAFTASGFTQNDEYDKRTINTIVTYIPEEFKENHLKIYSYFWLKDLDQHSITNAPFSAFNQLLGEYGVVGILLFLIFYILFFLRRYQKIHYGLYFIPFLLLILMTDYWFEELSVVILFELFLFLDIKKRKQLSEGA